MSQRGAWWLVSPEGNMARGRYKTARKAMRHAIGSVSDWTPVRAKDGSEANAIMRERITSKRK